MKISRLLFAWGLLFAVSAQLSADTKTFDWKDDSPKPLGDNGKFIKKADASIAPSQLGEFLGAIHLLPKGSSKKSSKAVEEPPRSDDTYVVHVAVWGEPTRGLEKDGPVKTQIDKQNWYVYQSGHLSDEDIQKNKRLFGVKRIWLVYVLLNANKSLNYDVSYQLSVKGKTSAYLQHLTSIVEAFNPGSIEIETKKEDDLTSRWGMHCFEIPYRPSDLTFTPTLTLGAPATNGLKFGASGDELRGAKAETFDNEGLYNIDFSVGVPFKKISDLNYVSTSNTLVPAKVTQENILGLFNVSVRGTAP